MKIYSSFSCDAFAFLTLDQAANLLIALRKADREKERDLKTTIDTQICIAANAEQDMAEAEGDHNEPTGWHTVVMTHRLFDVEVVSAASNGAGFTYRSESVERLEDDFRAEAGKPQPDRPIRDHVVAEWVKAYLIDEAEGASGVVCVEVTADNREFVEGL